MPGFAVLLVIILRVGNELPCLPVEVKQGFMSFKCLIALFCDNYKNLIIWIKDLPFLGGYGI